MKTKRPLPNRVLIVSAGYLLATTPTFAQVSPSFSLAPGVIASVNGVNITQSQLERWSHTTGQSGNPKTNGTLQRELIEREVLRQNAEESHYGTKPEVVDEMDAAKANAESLLYLRDHIHPEPTTDAQVRQEYQTLIAGLGENSYRSSVISVADKATASGILRELKSGKDFDTLAEQYSIAPSKINGGRLPWLSFKVPVKEGMTQGLPLPVAQAIATLPVGSISPRAIQVVDGNRTVYVIVKLNAKLPTPIPEYENSKDAIREQLERSARQKASDAFIADLVSQAKIVQENPSPQP